MLRRNATRARRERECHQAKEIRFFYLKESKLLSCHSVKSNPGDRRRRKKLGKRALAEISMGPKVRTRLSRVLAASLNHPPCLSRPPPPSPPPSPLSSPSHTPAMARIKEKGKAGGSSCLLAFSGRLADACSLKQELAHDPDGRFRCFHRPPRRPQPPRTTSRGTRRSRRYVLVLLVNRGLGSPSSRPDRLSDHPPPTPARPAHL